VATAPIQPLTWGPPYAAGAAQEIATTTTTTKDKKTKKKKKKKKKIAFRELQDRRKINERCSKGKSPGNIRVQVLWLSIAI